LFCPLSLSHSFTPLFLSLALLVYIINISTNSNYGGYLESALYAAGWSSADVQKVKIWNSGYPKEPQLGYCSISPTRNAVQNDDADQQTSGSTSRDMGDQGCVLVEGCLEDTHRGRHVPSRVLFTVYCTLFTIHCVLYTVYCTLFTVYCQQCCCFYFYDSIPVYLRCLLFLLVLVFRSLSLFHFLFSIFSPSCFSSVCCPSLPSLPCFGRLRNKVV
jgi:hypothetical protein